MGLPFDQVAQAGVVIQVSQTYGDIVFDTVANVPPDSLPQPQVVVSKNEPA